jgi:hypothetical protein
MKIIKNRKYAIKLFLMLLALSSFHVMAQRAPTEFSVQAAGGVSTYCFAPSPKPYSSAGFSTDFGAGFTGFLNRQLGIHVGIGFGLFNVKSKVSNLKTVLPGLYDSDNDMKYDLHSTLSDYTEIHKSLFLNIPIMLQFQTQQKQYWSWKQSPKANFYAMGGLKLLFLFNNKYDAHVRMLSNAAYYPEYNNWTATQIFAGYGDFKTGYSGSGKMEFGVMAMFALELGAKWWLGNNLNIYTGAFFDCGLNDPIKDSRDSYNKYTSEASLEGLEDYEGLKILKVSDRANMIVVGIKVRFAFSRLQRRY